MSNLDASGHVFVYSVCMRCGLSFNAAQAQTSRRCAAARDMDAPAELAQTPPPEGLSAAEKERIWRAIVASAG